jgi:hypothetical protein
MEVRPAPDRDTSALPAIFMIIPEPSVEFRSRDVEPLCRIPTVSRMMQLPCSDHEGSGNGHRVSPGHLVTSVQLECRAREQLWGSIESCSGSATQLLDMFVKQRSWLDP